ncbi:MAG: FHA domain-containing protein [Planctomycetota bacterium]
MAPPPALSMRVRTPGQRSIQLKPGQTLTIGRHSDNDIVLAGGLVSRHHARVVWDPLEDRPYVEDLKSANGVEVDGHLIEERYYLVGESTQVDVGEHLLVFELVGGRTRAKLLSSAAALVEGLSDKTTVALFNDKGAAIEGTFSELGALRRAMVMIEDEDRTGTLRVQCGTREFKLTFMQGKVITASAPGRVSGQEAFDLLLAETAGQFRFSREVEPAEATLEISPRVLFCDAEDTTRIRPLPPRL